VKKVYLVAYEMWINMHNSGRKPKFTMDRMIKIKKQETGEAS